jgi:hypothetical protein
MDSAVPNFYTKSLSTILQMCRRDAYAGWFWLKKKILRVPSIRLYRVVVHAWLLQPDENSIPSQLSPHGTVS